MAQSTQWPGSNSQPPTHQPDAHATEPPRLAKKKKKIERAITSIIIGRFYSKSNLIYIL